ncbi:hypothetical protein QTP99_09055 [Caldanaerobacter subterraneus KAk]|uniref:hypothetical protein n=1 Tax=Caldanaerobacter subterraneus TaxID=911092 RepID=UPI0032BFDBC7
MTTLLQVSGIFYMDTKSEGIPNLRIPLQVSGIFYMDTKPTEFVSLYKLAYLITQNDTKCNKIGTFKNAKKLDTQGFEAYKQLKSVSGCLSGNFSYEGTANMVVSFDNSSLCINLLPLCV